MMTMVMLGKPRSLHTSTTQYFIGRTTLSNHQNNYVKDTYYIINEMILLK